MKTAFPNILVVGNYSKPEYLGCFDVYLRGVSPRLEDKDKYYLYRKLETKKFPTTKDISDKLIALIMIYGSSFNMEAAQKQHLKAYPEKFAKLFKNAHEHPLQLSEEGEKAKEKLENSKKKPVIILFIIFSHKSIQKELSYYVKTGDVEKYMSKSKMDQADVLTIQVYINSDHITAIGPKLGHAANVDGEIKDAPKVLISVID